MLPFSMYANLSTFLSKRTSFRRKERPMNSTIGEEKKRRKRKKQSAAGSHQKKTSGCLPHQTNEQKKTDSNITTKSVHPQRNSIGSRQRRRPVTSSGGRKGHTAGANHSGAGERKQLMTSSKKNIAAPSSSSSSSSSSALPWFLTEHAARVKKEAVQREQDHRQHQHKGKSDHWWTGKHSSPPSGVFFTGDESGEQVLNNKESRTEVMRGGRCSEDNNGSTMLKEHCRSQQHSTAITSTTYSSFRRLSKVAERETSAVIEAGGVFDSDSDEDEDIEIEGGKSESDRGSTITDGDNSSTTVTIICGNYRDHSGGTTMGRREEGDTMRMPSDLLHHHHHHHHLPPAIATAGGSSDSGERTKGKEEEDHTATGRSDAATQQQNPPVSTTTTTSSPFETHKEANVQMLAKICADEILGRSIRRAFYTATREEEVGDVLSLLQFRTFVVEARLIEHGMSSSSVNIMYTTLTKPLSVMTLATFSLAVFFISSMLCKVNTEDDDFEALKIFADKFLVPFVDKFLPIPLDPLVYFDREDPLVHRLLYEYSPALEQFFMLAAQDPVLPRRKQQFTRVVPATHSNKPRTTQQQQQSTAGSSSSDGSPIEERTTASTTSSGSGEAEILVALKKLYPFVDEDHQDYYVHGCQYKKFLRLSDIVRLVGSLVMSGTSPSSPRAATTFGGQQLLTTQDIVRAARASILRYDDHPYRHPFDPTTSVYSLGAQCSSAGGGKRSNSRSSGSSSGGTASSTDIFLLFPEFVDVLVRVAALIFNAPHRKGSAHRTVGGGGGGGATQEQGSPLKRRKSSLFSSATGFSPTPHTPTAAAGGSSMRGHASMKNIHSLSFSYSGAGISPSSSLMRNNNNNNRVQSVGDALRKLLQNNFTELFEETLQMPMEAVLRHPFTAAEGATELLKINGAIHLRLLPPTILSIQLHDAFALKHGGQRLKSLFSIHQGGDDSHSTCGGILGFGDRKKRKMMRMRGAAVLSKMFLTVEEGGEELLLTVGRSDHPRSTSNNAHRTDDRDCEGPKMRSGRGGANNSGGTDDDIYVLFNNRVSIQCHGLHRNAGSAASSNNNRIETKGTRSGGVVLPRISHVLVTTPPLRNLFVEQQNSLPRLSNDDHRCQEEEHLPHDELKYSPPQSVSSEKEKEEGTTEMGPHVNETSSSSSSSSSKLQRAMSFAPPSSMRKMAMSKKQTQEENTKIYCNPPAGQSPATTTTTSNTAAYLDQKPWRYVRCVQDGTTKVRVFAELRFPISLRYSRDGLRWSSPVDVDGTVAHALKSVADNGGRGANRRRQGLTHPAASSSFSSSSLQLPNMIFYKKKLPMCCVPEDILEVLAQTFRSYSSFGDPLSTEYMTFSRWYHMCASLFLLTECVSTTGGGGDGELAVAAESLMEQKLTILTSETFTRVNRSGNHTNNREITLEKIPKVNYQHVRRAFNAHCSGGGTDIVGSNRSGRHRRRRSCYGGEGGEETVGVDRASSSSVIYTLDFTATISALLEIIVNENAARGSRVGAAGTISIMSELRWWDTLWCCMELEKERRLRYSSSPPPTAAPLTTDTVHPVSPPHDDVPNRLSGEQEEGEGRKEPMETTISANNPNQLLKESILELAATTLRDQDALGETIRLVFGAGDEDTNVRHQEERRKTRTTDHQYQEEGHKSAMITPKRDRGARGQIIDEHHHHHIPSSRHAHLHQQNKEPLSYYLDPMRSSLPLHLTKEDVLVNVTKEILADLSLVLPMRYPSHAVFSGSTGEYLGTLIGDPTAAVLMPSPSRTTSGRNVAETYSSATYSLSAAAARERRGPSGGGCLRTRCVSMLPPEGGPTATSQNSSTSSSFCSWPAEIRDLLTTTNTLPYIAIAKRLVAHGFQLLSCAPDALRHATTSLNVRRVKGGIQARVGRPSFFSTDTSSVTGGQKGIHEEADEVSSMDINTNNRLIVPRPPPTMMTQSHVGPLGRRLWTLTRRKKNTNSFSTLITEKSNAITAALPPSDATTFTTTTTTTTSIEGCLSNVPGQISTLNWVPVEGTLQSPIASLTLYSTEHTSVEFSELKDLFLNAHYSVSCSSSSSYVDGGAELRKGLAELGFDCNPTFPNAS